jgi:pentatricopeptide repeat protein
MPPKHIELLKRTLMRALATPNESKIDQLFKLHKFKCNGGTIEPIDFSYDVLLYRSRRGYFQNTIHLLDHLRGVQAQFTSTMISRLLCAAVRHRQYDVMRYMTQHFSHIQLSNSDLHYIVSACVSSGMFKQAVHFFRIIVLRRGEIQIPVVTLLLEQLREHYRYNGEYLWEVITILKKEMSLVERIDSHLFSALLHAVATTGDISETVYWFEKMIRLNVTPDILHVNALLLSLALNQSFNEIKIMINRIIPELYSLTPDFYSYTMFIMASDSMINFKHAVDTFANNCDSSKTSVESLTVVLQKLIQFSKRNEAVEWYRSAIRTNSTPDGPVFTIMLNEFYDDPNILAEVYADYKHFQPTLSQTCEANLLPIVAYRVKEFREEVLRIIQEKDAAKIKVYAARSPSLFYSLCTVLKSEKDVRFEEVSSYLEQLNLVNTLSFL